MPCRVSSHPISSPLISLPPRREPSPLLMITTAVHAVAQARAAMWIGADAVTLGGSLNDPVKQVMP